jgi:tetratricopeptide (TPR) repeat protein
MTAKFFKGPLALLIFSVSISAGVGVANAQYENMGDMPQMQSPPADKEKPKPAGPPVNKAEEDAYKAFLAVRTSSPDAQVKAGEDFATKFPQSHYLGGVYGTLTAAYFSLGQEDKMFADGAKALELNPDNVDVLSLLALSIPRRAKSSAPDFQQQLQKAEGYAHHAIELIPNLPKPAEMDDASFEKAKNEKLSLSHSGLGLIDLDHSKYEDARTELMLAVQLATSPDPVDYYLLGNADSRASYLHGAIAAYDKCAASGPLTAQCKARSDSVKKDLATSLSKD